MSDHIHYEELAALAAGGYLSADEYREFREHLKNCPWCHQTLGELSEIFQVGLPLTRGTLHDFTDKLKATPSTTLRDQFLRQATLSGAQFSSAVERDSSHRIFSLNVVAMAGTAVVAVIIAALLYGLQISGRKDISKPVAKVQSYTQPGSSQSEVIQLNNKLSEKEQTIVQQEAKIKSLNTRLEATARAAETLRHDSEIKSSQAQEATVRNEQLLTEFRNRDKLLADSRAELARLQNVTAGNEATTVAQQVRITELSEQLRIANANLELERELALKGKDVRDLMGARRLHVVDVRDTNSAGKAGKAFGRVFLTEGKSLIFYAFDLNEDKLVNAKHTFEVWGQQESKSGVVRSLGFLYVDDKAQKRWALKIDKPELVSEIDSVFVTVEPVGGSRKPSGQRMLYAYLGEPNHP
jgi:hypothetical protein